MANVWITAGIVVACLIVFLLYTLIVIYATCMQARKSTDQRAEPQDLAPSETEMTAN